MIKLLLLLLFRHLSPVVCDNEWQLEWTWIELEKAGPVFSRFNSLPSKIKKKSYYGDFSTELT